MNEKQERLDMLDNKKVYLSLKECYNEIDKIENGDTCAGAQAGECDLNKEALINDELDKIKKIYINHYSYMSYIYELFMVKKISNNYKRKRNEIKDFHIDTQEKIQRYLSYKDRKMEIDSEYLLCPAVVDFKDEDQRSTKVDIKQTFAYPEDTCAGAQMSECDKVPRGEDECMIF